jgi:hypothetical protein
VAVERGRSEQGLEHDATHKVAVPIRRTHEVTVAIFYIDNSGKCISLFLLFV